MAATDMRTIEFKDGSRIHRLSNEGHVYGYLGMEPDGTARIYRQVWSNDWEPTVYVFPGFISAARALISGRY